MSGLICRTRRELQKGNAMAYLRRGPVWYMMGAAKLMMLSEVAYFGHKHCKIETSTYRQAEVLVSTKLFLDEICPVCLLSFAYTLSATCEAFAKSFSSVFLSKLSLLYLHRDSAIWPSTTRSLHPLSPHTLLVSRPLSSSHLPSPSPPSAAAFFASTLPFRSLTHRLISDCRIQRNFNSCGRERKRKQK